MEGKHDWHVFIVNVHNVRHCAMPAGWYFLLRPYFLPPFPLPRRPVFSSDDVRRYFSRYFSGLNARRHTTRRGIMPSSTQPVISPHVTLLDAYLPSFPCRGITMKCSSGESGRGWRPADGDTRNAKWRFPSDDRRMIIYTQDIATQMRQCFRISHTISDDPFNERPLSGSCPYRNSVM
jgi:hypothetical protein